MPKPHILVPSQHSLLSFVKERSGQNPLRCYQCGKCTAGCPAAPDMDLGPRQIMRAVQLGLKDEILNSRSIWVCLQCQTCSARCPMEIDIARVMEVLRLVAILEKHPSAEKEIEVFHKAFLDVVKRHGRANEIELGVRYNLGSRRLLANIGRLPHMLSHGKLKIRPSNIENPRHVKGIMDRAQGLGSPMQ